MFLEGGKINLNFMLGASKMGPWGKNKVCRANYIHFYEENGGPQKYAGRAQNARHHRVKRNTAARIQFSALGCPSLGAALRS